MPWLKTEYEHTITAVGTSYGTIDTTNGGSTSLGTQSATDAPLGEKCFQLKLTGTSATVIVEVRNGSGDWVAAAVITLDATTPSFDFSIYRAWDQYRFNCTAFVGTNVKAFVTAG